MDFETMWKVETHDDVSRRRRKKNPSKNLDVLSAV
jgi:hypothetical protein